MVSGQKLNMKLNEIQTANMIKFTCTRPSDRREKIIKGVREMNINGSPQFAEMGMKMDSEMIRVRSRILEDPLIKYQDSVCLNGKCSSTPQCITPRQGAWNLKDRVFLNGATIKNWGCIVFASEREAPSQKVEAFIEALVRMSAACGLQVANRRPRYIYAQPDPRFVPQKMKELNDMVKKESNANMEFVLCVVCGPADIYSTAAKSIYCNNFSCH